MRKNRGLTLQEVADQTGIACSTLSAIETNKRVPSFETLDRLARVLRMPVECLVSAVRCPEVVHERCAELPPDTAGKMQHGCGTDLGCCRVYRCRAKAGCRVSPPQMHKGFVEMLYVLSGRALVTVGETAYTLGPDEVLLFDGGRQHRYEALEDVDALSFHGQNEVSFREALAGFALDDSRIKVLTAM